MTFAGGTHAQEAPPGYHDAAAAYEAYAQADYAQAAELAARATAASPDHLGWRMLLINARALSGDTAGARKAFEGLPQDLPQENLLEGGYAAQRLGYKEQASRWFKQSIDAADRDELQMDATSRRNVRQTITDLDRRFGMTAALAYGQVGVMNPDYLQTGATRETLQSSVELWWRPAALNRHYGKSFDVYARANETLYDGTGGAIGSKTVQTVLGVKLKPWEKHNAVFALERLLYTQGHSRNDWLLRAAWSAGAGGVTRFDTPSWRYWNVYAEADYFLKRPQFLSVIEGRYGRRFRLDAINPELTVAPFMGVAANYDSKTQPRHSIGVGPGLNFRLAFRSDHYHAAQSSVDLTVQYRVRVAGDKRGRGFFGTLVYYW